MIHLKVWAGANSARIVDMTNAGKRGKRCSVLRVSGVPWAESPRETAEQRMAREWSAKVFYKIEDLAPSSRYDGATVDLEYSRVAEFVHFLILEAHGAGVPPHYLEAYDEEIRGIEAPRPVLSAGVEGKWSAGADETGISMRQHDDINEWSEITAHDQTGPRAYEIAVKVWDKVKQAKTLHEAADILRTAGAKLHGYCAMD